LNIFEKHNIPATWAVVGHLFLDHCEKEDGIPHKDMPRFKEDWYSCDPCSNIQRDPSYYGKDIVEKISASPVEHEIGYHSFSHVIFSECSREVAEAEIKEGIKLAKEFGVTLRSFVFPQHEIGHINILKEYGFMIYRGLRERHLGDRENLLLRKLGGGIDKLIALPTEPKWMDGIWEIPCSIQFQDLWLFRPTLIFRAKRGINRAIKEKKVFHLYLHPEVLLSQPSLVKKLDKLMNFVAKKKDEGKIEVMTMGELASHLKLK
jgi:peptidoglycan/xylan/chitin deacetylase (PgdA/CDA1 family)